MTYRDKDVSFGRKNDFPRLIQGLQPRGEREKWYRKFKELRAIDNIPLNFATAATLCAPIQAVIEGDGFVCDLYGNSGCGKSVIDKTAATIWGDNHFSAGFVYSAKSTDCAIEIALDTLHCLPLIIEDFNQLDTRKKRAFMQSVMLIANGIGKARGQKDMSLRSQLIWKTVAIINSEQPITAYFTKVLSRYLNLSDTVEGSSCRHIQATLFNIRRLECRLLSKFSDIVISRLCKKRRKGNTDFMSGTL